MANKLKAEEIALKNSKEYLVSKNNSHQQDILFKENSIVECEKCAMEMAEWKEQEMIEKFMKFLHTECYDARLLHWKDEIIRQKIEKAMREE